MNKTKSDKGTIIRTVVLAVALLNQGLVMAGWDTLPFTSEEVEQFVTYAFTVIATLIAWFKNNYVTDKGKHQKEILQRRGAE